MTVLHVSLFGKLRVCHDEQVLTSLEARKVQELFCYLLLYRDRPHPRETLTDLLWNGNSTAQAKKYLRHTLWQLQSTLYAHVEPCQSHFLLVEADWIQLNPATTLWLDVAVFEQAFAMTQGIPGYALDAQQKQALQLAIQLYQGDLLEGWYQEWCLFERERLQNMYLEMLSKLMDACEAVQEYEAGLIYGARILRCDLAHEPTHRRLMRLHYLTGNRTAALRQYRRCLSALKEELDVKPGKSTVSLYEQICADRLSGVTTVLPQTNAPSASLSEVLEHLHRLQSELTTIQHQLQQDIQAIEFIMKAKR